MNLSCTKRREVRGGSTASTNSFWTSLDSCVVDWLKLSLLTTAKTLQHNVIAWKFSWRSVREAMHKTM